ncbi:MAG TPA: SRPBCC domain-containing protein [Puia sp.]|nr:SRPBCC domain-containing protein [Puia sp.]
MQQAIKQTWFFHHLPQEVWEYLTKPELIEQWLGKTDFQPLAGHKFRFISSYGNDSHCEVLEVKPFTKLTYSWQKNSAKNGKPFHSIVAWTLVPKEKGTELQLEHHGFTALEDIAPHENGWNTCLIQFEKLLNEKKNDSTIL